MKYHKASPRARRARLGKQQASVRSMPAALVKQIVAVANDVRGILTSDFAIVQSLVDEHDLVFGVWQDHREPNGVGVLLVKGQAKLREILAANVTEGMAMTAIPCICAEQAEALRQVAGEQDRRH